MATKAGSLLSRVVSVYGTIRIGGFRLRRIFLFGCGSAATGSSAVAFTHFQRINQLLWIESKLGAMALIKPVRGNQMDI